MSSKKSDSNTHTLITDKKAVWSYLEKAEGQDKKFAIIFRLDDRLYDDAEFMLEFLKEIREYDDNSYYRLASPRLQHDRQFALKVCEKMACFFKDFPDELRDDKEILRLAVANHFDSFNHASERLRNNLSFCRELMKYNPDIYPYLPENLKTDLPIIELSLKSSSNLLYYPAAVRSNKKLLLTALSHPPSPFALSASAKDFEQKLSPEMLADEEISLAMVSQDSEHYNNLIRESRINLKVIHKTLENLDNWSDGLHALAVQINALSLEMSQTRLEPKYTCNTLLQKTTTLMSQQLHMELRNQKGVRVGDTPVGAGAKPDVKIKKTLGNRI